MASTTVVRQRIQQALAVRKSLTTDELEEVDSAEIENIEDHIDGEYGSLVRHETRR